MSRLPCGPFAVHSVRKPVAQRAAGASGRPVFPAPSFLKEGEKMSKARAKQAARTRCHACLKFGPKTSEDRVPKLRDGYRVRGRCPVKRL